MTLTLTVSMFKFVWSGGPYCDISHTKAPLKPFAQIRMWDIETAKSMIGEIGEPDTADKFAAKCTEWISTEAFDWLRSGELSIHVLENAS
jgi:hypothetical protein